MKPAFARRPRVLASTALAVVVLCVWWSWPRDPLPVAARWRTPAGSDWPLAFTSDGRALFLVRRLAGCLVLRELDSGRERVFYGPGGRAFSVQLSPGGARALVAWDQADTHTSSLTVLDLSSGEVLWRLLSTKHESFSAAFSADGSSVVVLASSTDQDRRPTRIIRRWNTRDWSESPTLSVPKEIIDATWQRFAGLTPGARDIVCRRSELELELLTLPDFRRRPFRADPERRGTNTRIWGYDVSPDGSLLIAGCWLEGTWMWDVASGKGRPIAVPHHAGLGSCGGPITSDNRFHADRGDRLGRRPHWEDIRRRLTKDQSAGSSDSEIVLWDLNAERAVATFRGQAGVCFSPDGALMATTTVKGAEMTVWRLPGPKAR